MIKQCHVGVKGVVRVDDKCLVVRKDTEKGSFWDIPGGRIDEEETLFETLERELKEELPSIPKYSVDELLGVHRHRKNLPDNTGIVLIFYKIITTPFEVVLSPEHADYKWVTKETVSELLDSDIHIEPAYYDIVVKSLEK